MSQNLKLTVIILDYLKANKVIRNVHSLLNQKVDFKFFIYIVDNSVNRKNAFLLQTIRDLKNIRIIVNSKNEGYPIPHNKIVSQVDSEYLLILNPDIHFYNTDTLQKMIDYMDKNTNVGILGPKQINDDLSRALTVRAFPKLHVQIKRRTFLRYLPFFKKQVAYDEMQHLDLEKIQNVDWIQSSCIMVRKNVWDEIGGFNDEYFLFMADTELSLEVWKRGYKVVYNPEVQVYADGIRCSSGMFSWVIRQHFKDALLYSKKHKGETIKSRN